MVGDQEPMSEIKVMLAISVKLGATDSSIS